MKCYLVVLEGIGETEIKLIKKETFDWINNEKVKPPQFQIEQYSKDTQAYSRPLTEKEAEDELSGWRGSSPDNDRALQARPDYESFSSHKKLMKYVRDNDVEIIDTYEGVIY